jgi:predicted nucleic acid-binding Zn ribbon protein
VKSRDEILEEVKRIRELMEQRDKRAKRNRAIEWAANFIIGLLVGVILLLLGGWHR